MKQDVSFDNALRLIEEKANALLLQKEAIILAIDGRCASGKTTLAKALAARLFAQVVACDDFFLPPEKRTAERLLEIGGNMERERLLAEVLLPLTNNQSASYRPFVCQTASYGEPVTLLPSRIVIVEGSYSCHSDLRNCYDLTVFLSINEAEQRRRIEKRNPTNANAFFEKWIPLEERYFAGSKVEQTAGLSLTIASFA